MRLGSKVVHLCLSYSRTRIIPQATWRKEESSYTALCRHHVHLCLCVRHFTPVHRKTHFLISFPMYWQTNHNPNNITLNWIVQIVATGFRKQGEEAKRQSGLREDYANDFPKDPYSLLHPGNSILWARGLTRTGLKYILGECGCCMYKMGFFCNTTVFIIKYTTQK